MYRVNNMFNLFFFDRGFKLFELKHSKTIFIIMIKYLLQLLFYYNMMQIIMLNIVIKYYFRNKEIS